MFLVHVRQKRHPRHFLVVFSGPPKETASRSADPLVFLRCEDGRVGLYKHCGARSRRPRSHLRPAIKILLIDIGGTNVKILATGHDEVRKIPSGSEMTAQM